MTREEAINILKPLRAMMFDQHGCPISDAAIALDIVIEALEAQKDGEWIACEHDKWMPGVYALRCSNCNGGYHLSTEITIGTWDFCPNCGARMTKE